MLLYVLVDKHVPLTRQVWTMMSLCSVSHDFRTMQTHQNTNQESYTYTLIYQAWVILVFILSIV